MSDLKNLCFLIQGKTFLKSIIPLVVFCNVENIVPTIFLVEQRPGKNYDNLVFCKDLIENIKKSYNIVGNFVWVKNQKAALDIMRHNNFKNIVCQDAHQHGRLFCNHDKITVFSVGVFFDTLHHANDIRLKRIKLEKRNLPNFSYVVDKRFSEKFKSLCPDYPVEIIPIGCPLLDHALFINKDNEKKKKNVTFLVTMQNLITSEMQNEIEDFARYCIGHNITFNVKTKHRTPWQFKDSSILSKINVSDFESGFPSSSSQLILNSDVIISSYSTCAVEAEYFGTRCINLDSVRKEKLSYAVKSIKFDYQMEDLFNSKNCLTIDKNLKSNVLELLAKESPLLNNFVSFENNSSRRILKDIYNKIKM